MQKLKLEPINSKTSETDSYKHLGLIFHRTLPWHHHNLSIKETPHSDVTA